MQASAMSLNSSSFCTTAIQAPYRPGGRGCQASATPLLLSYGNVVAASQHRCIAVYSACRISLKNVDRSTSRLQRETRLTKSSGGGGQGHLGKQGAAGLVVRATTSIGVVKEVRTEVEGLYYNVTLSVPRTSVLEWYSSPGQYVNLLPVKTAQNSSVAFFVASSLPPPVPRPPAPTEIPLEFLIQETGTDSVANEIVNSQVGDSVIINAPTSNGFNYFPVQAAESVLMFASGYGLGPIRAFIETGFGANQKKDAILYTMYAPKQEPYTEKHPLWEKLGVTVVPFECSIKSTDPAKTAVLLVASVDEQEKLIKYFEAKGVPSSNIITLFDGIPTEDKLYINKVQSKPNFLHMGKKHTPFALNL